MRASTSMVVGTSSKQHLKKASIPHIDDLFYILKYYVSLLVEAFYDTMIVISSSALILDF